MRISRWATNVLLGALLAGSSAVIGVATGVTSAAAAPYSCASINGLTVVKTNSVAGSVDYSATVNFVAGDTLTATWSSISGTSTGSSLYVPTSRQVYVGASSETMFYTVTAVDIGAGYWAPEFKAVLSGTVTSATITITCRNSSTIAEEVVSVQPVAASLTLDPVGSGAQCDGGSSVSGVVGQWVTLPASDDCSSTVSPSAKLLGWSTMAAFPVEIAQRQVTNGWGAYEIVNESGRVTSLFIPAGQSALLSQSNSLYPIWG